MARLRRCLGALVLGFPAFVVAGVAEEGLRKAPDQTRVNPQAEVLQDFQNRVKQYMELRKEAERKSPKLEETRDAARIRSARDALAANLRELRADAKQGEIFTPEIARHFRGLMYPKTKGREGAETKQAIKEDQPAPASVRLKVNASYPEDEPLPTVPPNLLMNLPKLPEGLEYRVVGNHLILRDGTANLIVDFIPNAIQVR